MAVMDIFLAGWEFLDTPNTTAGLRMFLAERNPAWDSVSSHVANLVDWIPRPDVPWFITVWSITFAVVVATVPHLGFGPSGIIARSLAAGFQACTYGAFTPAGSIFATLTRLGMKGLLARPAVALGAIVATIAVYVVWLYR